MRAALVTFCATAVLGVGGCGCSGQGPDRRSSGPLVTYERSGGIAAMPERLVIETDGAATIEAGIGGARARFDLGADELDLLRAELDAADLAGVAGPEQPPACADCFVYEIAYDGNTVGYDEAHPPSEAVTSVVSHLGRITADHYPAEAATPLQG